MSKPGAIVTKKKKKKKTKEKLCEGKHSFLGDTVEI